MKKLITLTLLVAILTALPFCLKAQEPEKTSFVFAGYNYSGTPGISFGLGATIGRVSIAPFGKFVFNDTAYSTGGITYDKQAGIRIIYWPDFADQEYFKIGLNAGPADVNWLEAQDQELPVYWAQTIGLTLIWKASENINVFVSGNGTAQLLDQDSRFKERVDLTAGLSIPAAFLGL
jgi:hypothetical protein